jgi:uncharacterized protein YjbI with pentapeptide repeats
VIVKNLSDLTRANFADANLAGANFAGANLTDANFAGANLADANLAGANMRGANLTGANIRGANLTGANMRGAKLADAHLTGACGIICAGYDTRGYRFLGVKQDDVPWHVLAGCRWFAPNKAREHWRNNKDALARLAVIANAFDVS